MAWSVRLRRWKNQLLARWYAGDPERLRRWVARANLETLPPPPWAPVRKPLAQGTLALLTSGGVHLDTQPPYDMADPNGDPSFREIPVSVPRERLRITHDYYDHRDAEKDINVVLPLDRAAEFVAEGLLGGLFPTAFSVMGHITGPHVRTLVERTAPAIADRLVAGEVDFALLTPA